MTDHKPAGTRVRIFAFTLFAACLAGNAAEAQEAADPSFRIVSNTRETVVARDGSSVFKTHSEIKVLKQQAIPVLGQQRLDYTEQAQTLNVTEAYTMKPDGRRITVGPDAILDQQGGNSQSSLVFTGLRQKVIVYPDVEPGDMLVYTAVVTSKPQLADYFTYDTILPDALPIDQVRISVAFPNSMPVQVDARDVQVNRTTGSGLATYRIDYSNPNPRLQSRALSAFDLAPRFSISTIPSFDVLSSTYYGLVKPALAVTPAVKAKADEITAGTSDPSEQARKLYGWVAQHIRYLAITLGEGGLIPHTPDQILSNAYGDCKDHAALFLVLLKAKGIDSELILINSTNTYSISKAPTLGSFDHMINWIPELKLYADTTTGRYVPFGELPTNEYGKPALHLGEGRPALQQTPAPDMNSTEISYRHHMVMDDQGRISSESSLTGRGMFSVPLRELGTLIEGNNAPWFSKLLLQRSRTPNAVGGLTASAPDEQSGAYEIGAHYVTPGVFPALAAGTGFGFQDSLLAADPFGATFFGPASNPALLGANPVPCFNGRAVDDESLTYPQSRHLAALPGDSKFSTEHVDYISRWSDNGNTVAVHRELAIHFNGMLCDASAHNEIAGVHMQIVLDRRATIALPPRTQ
jgi:transglutaminase-like putative cysteine protease